MNRVVFGILLFLPSLGAAVWTVQPSLAALLAVRSLTPKAFAESSITDTESVMQYKRDIQRTFSNSGIHVPLEDIALGKTAVDDDSRIQNLNTKACGGRADLYVWLPLRFRLPVIGEKVVDRCWRFHWGRAG